MRLSVKVATAVAATALLGGCGSTAASPAGGAAPATPATPATPAASATPSTPAASAPSTATSATSAAAVTLGKATVKAGTAPAVLKARPKVTTSVTLPMPVAQQKAAAAWLAGFLHRSTLDVKNLPEKRTPQMFTDEMTANAHKDFAKQVGAGQGSWGAEWTREWKDSVLIEAVDDFTMTAYSHYKAPAGRNGVVFKVEWKQVMTVLPGSPGGNVEQYRGRYHYGTYVGVIPGPSADQPWQMDYWRFYKSNDFEKLPAR